MSQKVEVAVGVSSAAIFLDLDFRIPTLMACCIQALGGCNSRLGCAVLGFGFQMSAFGLRPRSLG